MTEVKYLTVSSEEAGQRLDNFLIKVLKGVPKSRIYRIIRNGEVRVNKKRAPVSQRLSLMDRVRIPPVRISEEKKFVMGQGMREQLNQAILFEDANLLVINKPSGIAVHGGSGIKLGVIEALRKMRSDLPYLELVHRLDRETSGCLLLAKKRSCLRGIQAALEARTVKKKYWAILTGRWEGKKQVLVEAPLKKNVLKSGERIVVVDKMGKSAQTNVQLIENFQEACFVEAWPKTGRTHQIRVHCASIGHPILGDGKYVCQSEGKCIEIKNKRLYLHAREIQFNLNDKSYCFEATLDNSFTQLLTTLRQGSK